MSKSILEIRTIAELRAEGTGDELSLSGYAATYNNFSHNLGGFIEKVAPGAFNRSLKEGADVVATFNHDPNKVLGRTKSKTLSISQDERGLKWTAQLDPANTEHRNLHSSVKRGDIDQCSFAFTVDKDGQSWEDADGSDGIWLKRTLTDVDLKDVAAVTYPAYPGTNVDARSGAFVPKEILALVEVRSAKVAGEKRAAEEQSLEDQIQAVNAALQAKYPSTYADGTVVPDGWNNGKYWTVETYADSAIICNWTVSPQEYFKITYHIGDDGKALIGDELTPMEQEWVPAGERAKVRAAEYRAKAEQFKAAQPTTRAHSQEHKEGAVGDCTDMECACQNRMVDPDDAWDATDTEDDTVDDQERAARKAARCAEQRKKGDKVRTKSVGGKNLPASAFAYVGDPEKTETWKLPIHDKDHAQNALARFNQTEGIPAAEKAKVYAKVKAAAEKFGINVSEDDDKRCLAGCLVPYTEDELRQRRARLLKAML